METENEKENHSKNEEEVQITTMGQKQKCNKCQFETWVPKYLKGHKVKHSGQFICQRGCTLKFTPFKDLDDHIKTPTTYNKTAWAVPNVQLREL